MVVVGGGIVVGELVVAGLLTAETDWAVLGVFCCCCCC